MNLKQLIQKRIEETIRPPDPPPILVAEISYPPHAWYELHNPQNMTPEAFADYLIQHFTLEQQAHIMKMLEKARRDVESPCGQRLVALFQRDDQGAWHVDDVRFMDPLELSAFLMQSGKNKPDFQWEAMPSTENEVNPRSGRVSLISSN